MRIKGVTLKSWQIDAAKVFSSLGKNDRMVMISPRQVGKSLLITQFAFFITLNKPKSVSVIISPVNRQNAKLFNQMKNMCVQSPLTKSANESKLEIEFINGSKILFLSAEAGDNLRGNTVTGVLIVDEACYVKENIWPIILPFVNVSRAPVVLSSTPRFRRGLYYEWYGKSLSHEEHYKLVNASNYDLSFFRSEETVEEFRKTLSKAFFKSEVLGDFMDVAEGVFGDYRKCIKEPDNFDIEYVGIDWSTTGIDSTQLIGFNEQKEMTFRKGFNSTDPMEIVDKIAEILNSCPKLKSVLVESNSIGEVYYSALKRALKNPIILKKFNTSNTSKKEIVERVIEAFNRAEITILDDDELKWQLDNFSIIPLKNGNYTYENNDANVHDDCVMALCICCKQFLTNKGKYNIL